MMTSVYGWRSMSSEEPKVHLGLIFVGWSLLGVFLADAVWQVWKPAPYDLILTLGPPLAVLAGFAFHTLRSKAFSLVSMTAVAAVMVGAVVVHLGVEGSWLTRFAFFVGPPAFALSSFLLASAFEKLREPISWETFKLVFGASIGVLLPAALLAEGLKPFRYNYLRTSLLLILVLVMVVWSGRYLISLRSTRTQ